MSDLHVSFRLFVAGQAPNSRRAVTNLNAFCRQFFEGRHEIEIVDVLIDPSRALAQKVLLTPTLRISAAQVDRTIIGDLSDSSVLLEALSFVIAEVAGTPVKGPAP